MCSGGGVISGWEMHQNLNSRETSVRKTTHDGVAKPVARSLLPSIAQDLFCVSVYESVFVLTCIFHLS